MVSQKKKRSQKVNTLLQLGLTLGLLVLVNILGQLMYSRLDLTEDGRYTLGDKTKSVMEGLEETIYVEVYLEGKDLQPGFKELRDATQETLDELRVFSGGLLEYTFIDPYEEFEGQDRANYFKQLASKGLAGFDVSDVRSSEVVRKTLWPGAILNLGEKEVPVTLLQNQIGRDPQVVLHNSIMRLEYELVSAIQLLKGKRRSRIAVVAGHGELGSEYLQKLTSALSVNYDVERMSLPNYKPGKLEQYDCAIVAKPDSAFSEVDLYKLDQYIMHGGRVLWLVDALHADLDSLRKPPFFTVSDKYPLKSLRGLLFKYGVRLNQNLLQDFSSHSIPIKYGSGGTVEDERKWPFYPTIIPSSTHPVVKGLGPIWLRFAGTIDTVSSPGVKKTILLQSSGNTKVLPHPVRIDMGMLKFNLSPDDFSMNEQITGVLLEGNFTSNYKNRVAPGTLSKEEFSNFKESSESTRMIVISDGDVFANQVGFDSRSGRTRIYNLGSDRFMNMHFDNKSLALNCIDYLIDDSGIFELRNKDYKLRLLDSARISDKGERLFWKVFNLVIPILLLALFGGLYLFVRKRKYTK